MGTSMRVPKLTTISVFCAEITIRSLQTVVTVLCSLYVCSASEYRKCYHSPVEACSLFTVWVMIESKIGNGHSFSSYGVYCTLWTCLPSAATWNKAARTEVWNWICSCPYFRYVVLWRWSPCGGMIHPILSGLPLGIETFFLFLWVGWDWVHLVRRPLFSYCTSPGWSMMIMEQLVEWGLAGETEVLGESLPHCHCVHHKSHMTWPGIEPGPPWHRDLL
jgi:hypothetical protein